MVYEDNDKWSDNGDLPINPEYSSNKLEDEVPKRKVAKNKVDYQRDMSMEELMNGPKYKEEPFKNMTNVPTKSDKEIYTRESSINDIEKNDRSKESSPNYNKKDIAISNEESRKGITTSKDISELGTEPEDAPPKDVAVLGKEPGSALSRETLPRETLPRETLSRETLSKDLQKMKDQLKKLKEEIKEPQYLKDLSKYIKNLDSNMTLLASGLKTFTDAKSWEAIQRGKIEVRRYANYYDVHGTITTAAASDPHDFDSAIYNVERIFESLERFSEIIYIANDGIDSLYVIVSHGGRTRFSTEAIIYPGEIKCYFNVYEVRLRSPTLGLQYRVTEYCINNISEISSIPIEKANLQNQALPAIGANWLTTDITPTNYPTTFMIEVAVSVAGNFSAIVTSAGSSQIVTFNVVPGPALVAGGLYIFNLLVHSGDSINFIYSATGGTIQVFRVQELDSASA